MRILNAVYKIINTINNRFYIGSSFNVGNRIGQHFRELKKGKHHSKLMQEDYDKFGKESFKIEIIEKIIEGNATLREREEYWINELNPEYNSHDLYSCSSIYLNNIVIEKIKEKIIKLNRRISWTEDGNALYQRVRRAYNTNVDFREWYDSTYPPDVWYTESDDEYVINKINEVKEFITVNKRRPLTSDDIWCKYSSLYKRVNNSNCEEFKKWVDEFLHSIYIDNLKNEIITCNYKLRKYCDSLFFQKIMIEYNKNEDFRKWVDLKCSIDSRTREDIKKEREELIKKRRLERKNSTIFNEEKLITEFKKYMILNNKRIDADFCKEHGSTKQNYYYQIYKNNVDFRKWVDLKFPRKTKEELLQEEIELINNIKQAIINNEGRLQTGHKYYHSCRRRVDKNDTNYYNEELDNWIKGYCDYTLKIKELEKIKEYKIRADKDIYAVRYMYNTNLRIKEYIDDNNLNYLMKRVKRNKQEELHKLKSYVELYGKITKENSLYKLFKKYYYHSSDKYDYYDEDFKNWYNSRI